MAEREVEDPLDPQHFMDASPDEESDAHLSVVCDALQEQDVTCVLVSYDGSGDSGCIHSVEYEPAGVQVPDWIDAAIRDCAENYCPDGYEINEGGYGTLKVYPFLGLAELEHHARYEDSQEMDAPMAQLPQDLRERLSALGVSRVTAHFDGYGDSGQMEEMAVEPESVTLEGDLEDDLEDFLLEQLPGGWENNEGGFGDFIVDVNPGTVERNAYWRVEEADDEVTRWKWRK